MAIICWLCVAQNTTALLIGFAAVFGSNSMANPKNEVMLALEQLQTCHPRAKREICYRQDF
jgi:hypothetical protein